MAALLVSSAFVAPAFAAPPPEPKIRYVVSPHPDDDFSGWGMVANDTSHYLVFIVATRGEETSFCDGRGLQEDYGERTPQPQPFTGRLTPNCEAQRIDSWHAFLDGMVAVNDNLDVPVSAGSQDGGISWDVTPARCHGGSCRISSEFDLHVGKKTARLVFDLGDGDLTPAEVTWAIQTARRIRSSSLPVTAADDIVGASYFNSSDAAYYLYDHGDHKAVRDALWDTDQKVPGPQWGRTVPSDPSRAVTVEIDDETYCAAMCVTPPPIDPDKNPTARRTGVFQRSFGWLAFTSNTYWPASQQPDVFLFSKSQDFWSRFAAG